MPSPLEYEFLASALCPTAAPRALGVVLIDEFKRVWVPSALGGHALSSLAGTASVEDSAGLTLTAAHANTNRIPSAALTYTINASTGWAVSDGMAIWLPVSGTISISVAGGPTANGATATILRALAGNPAGYVILNRIQGALAYNVSGA